MMDAIAIDDEPNALKIIEIFCAKTDNINLIKTFEKPTEGLAYLEKYSTDLLFVDINMPSITGLKLVEKLQQDTMVIFTTAHSQYAVEGFNLNAIDYLLKPFSFDRFTAAVQKAQAYHEFIRKKAQENRYIFVRADYKLNKINIDDLLFIEGLDDYLKIHISGQKTIVTRMTLKKILELLPQNEFIRVHKSYIVPLAKIEKIGNRIIQIADEEIPIGSAYEADVKKVLHL